MAKPKLPPAERTWLHNALRRDWERKWVKLIEDAMAKAKKGKGGGKKGCK